MNKARLNSRDILCSKNIFAGVLKCRIEAITISKDYSYTVSHEKCSIQQKLIMPSCDEIEDIPLIELKIYFEITFTLVKRPLKILGTLNL